MVRLPLLAPLLLVAHTLAQAPSTPRTVPETTGYAATSRAADVAAFCTALASLPHGDRIALQVAGRTALGHEQLLAHVAAAPANDERMRVLVVGNIHGGEVEGKEAVQELLREFALGEHEDLLAQFDLWFLPIYNVDGNEKLGANRTEQNGPPLCGERTNGKGLDLNRDFVKVDAPETRTLMRLFREIDPHLFFDLHTTNGSHHGYHLTYAPSVSPNVDPDVARLSRRLLDRATATMRDDHRFATFDYGNFETHDWDGGGAPESATGQRGWFTFDHRARYGTNYFALRNRIAILSEAYSHADFKTRIAATRAFVLSVLHAAVAEKAALVAAFAAADRRLTTPEAPAAFGFDSVFAPAETMDVLVGEIEKVPGENGAGPRFARKGDGHPESMPVIRGFVARQNRPLPFAWAVLSPSDDVIDRLRQHGVEFERLDAPRAVVASRFSVEKKRKPKPPFQGRQELVLTGAWRDAAPEELPAGALLVSARQRLARVAATLLEPESEDSLSTWTFFDATTTETFPVLRVDAPR